MRGIDPKLYESVNADVNIDTIDSKEGAKKCGGWLMPFHFAASAIYDDDSFAVPR